MTLLPLRPLQPVRPVSPPSDPPSGIRPRAADPADLHVLAGEILGKPGKWSRRLRVSGPDAEDLLQDALVLLVEHAREIEPRARWNWFSSALQNRRMRLSRDRARAAKIEPLLEGHLRDLPAPFAAPDAEILEEQRRDAARWLVEQVHPSRRRVAELHLWEDRMLEEIAVELSTPLGTIRSRWDRAKGDMRAAIEREQKKQGGLGWLVAIVALLSAAWFWLLGRSENRGVGVESTPRESASSARGRRSRRVFACAALPLLLSIHEESPQPTLAVDEGAIELGHVFSYAFAPNISVNAEREMEWGHGKAISSKGALVAQEPTDPEIKMARLLLTQASLAVARGDAATAKQMLRDYDRNVTNNFFAPFRTKVEASIRALDANRNSRLP